MKRIVIFTMGTRGDIQPYIYLAQALQKADYEVVIGTHPYWRELVLESNVIFAPLGPDTDIEAEAAIIRGKAKSPILGMIRTMKFVFKIIEESSNEVYELCKTADLVIASHSHIGAAEAQACRVKMISVTLQTETISEVYKPKTKMKAILDHIINSLINPMMVSSYNKIRKQYRLKLIKSMDEMLSNYLNLIPVSRYVIAQNPYWEEKNKVVGYWYNQEDYVPDDTLTYFLESGDKPIILALGAMSFEEGNEKEKLDVFVQAFEKTGMRAVIQGFKKTLTEYELPETMISVSAIPHSWLFSNGYCVIHHGGFGTSASSMLYGIPSIVIPHVLDQFALAERLYHLNVAVKPIKAGELTVEKVASAIEDMKINYLKISSNVSELSQKMHQENGLETSVKLIKDIVNEDD
jgi:sterol 3beta-glucosyltransferase